MAKRAVSLTILNIGDDLLMVSCYEYGHPVAMNAGHPIYAVNSLGRCASIRFGVEAE
jgi:hypothetical protein